MSTTKKYQFLPPLSEEEYRSLRDSIAESGVEVPIVVDQDGNVVDGFHRDLICHELGLQCPREVRTFESESEKYELSLRLNCRRRQLNRDQKRELIAVYLKRDPTIADNHLAENIGGVSKNTVAEVRKSLESTCQIDKFDTLRGKDGKSRPRQNKRILANTPREATAALRLINDLPANCEGKILDIRTARKRARSRTKPPDSLASEPLPDSYFQLFECRFQDLEELAALKPHSVNLILTDIPYGKEFVPEVQALGAFVSRVLVRGGLFVTYCGQYWLPAVLNALNENLAYRWTIASVWNGDAVPVHIGGRILSKWKPIVVFSNGDLARQGQWCDVTHVEDKEKNWHPWQQPLSEVERLISYFSRPGDLVVDPCGGSFTTAVGCFNLSRRFVGCDRDPACVQIGHHRLNEAKKFAEQQSLPSDYAFTYLRFTSTISA